MGSGRTLSPASSWELLVPFQVLLGQRRATELEASEGRDWREEENRRERKDGQILLTVEATLGSQETLGVESCCNWPGMAFALFLPFSLLSPLFLPLLVPPFFPPHIFIGSGNSVDLHARQSLATHTKRKPQPWRCGSVSSRCCSTV